MSNVSNEKTGLKRNILDKFYTKLEISKLCIDYVIKYLTIGENDIIIEPSAGSGAFSDELSKHYKNIIAMDIEPSSDNIIQQDYLTYINDDNQPIHIIGNPPFGRQSTLAKQFIKKSCTFCQSISFILPKSFKKTSFQKVFPLNFHNIFCIDLPDNSFLVNNIEYDVPCVFMIWLKKDQIRPKIISEGPLYYSYVKKSDDNIHFSIRRVGINAGVLYTNFENCSEQSHYFIKLDKPNKLDKFIEEYQKITYEFNNTVGPKSISKPELNNKLNKLNLNT